MNANTPANALRFADLLEPIAPDAPCGPDLEYDPAFVMLAAAVAPRASAQYGDFVDAPPPVNWAEAERDCRALMLRTKDIRLTVTLTRCRIRQAGATGLQEGVALLADLLERFGETLHPMPFYDGERDPVAFVNALAGLSDPDGLLADLRDIALPKSAGVQLQLRDVEKAFMVPRQKDALAPESASRMLRELWGRRDKTVVALAEAQRLVTTIGEWAHDALGNEAPDLAPLARLLHPFSAASLSATQGPAAAPAAEVAAPNTAGGSAPPHVPDAGASATEPAASMPSIAHAPSTVDRWTALETLRATRLWFEQNEPSSPVIVLLRQAERMVGKRFSEIAQAIPADLLAQWDQDGD